MFPIRNRRGNVIGFGARAIEKEDQPKYLNSPETPVFHKGSELYGLFELRRVKGSFDKILITEGYMDVIGLSQYGVENAIATLGTATTKTHIDTLLKQARHLVFCYDGDRAGREAAWRALKVCLPFLTGDYRLDFLFLPEGEDPDSVVQQKGQAGFEQLLSTAMPLSQFLCEHVSSETGLESLDARAAFVKSILPHLTQIPAGPFLDLMINQVAQMAQIGERQLRHQLSPAQSGQPAHAGEAATMHKPASHGLAEYLISWVVQYPELAMALEVSDFNATTKAGSVLIQLITYIRQHPNVTTGTLLAAEAFMPYAKRLSQLAAIAHPVSKEQATAELLDCLSKLQSLEEESHLNALIEKSKSHALSDAEKQEIDRLLRKNRH